MIRAGKPRTRPPPTPPRPLSQLARSQPARTSFIILGHILTMESLNFENTSLQGLVEDQAKRNVANWRKAVLLITKGQSQWFWALQTPAVSVAPKQKHNPTKGVSFQSLKKEDVRLTTDFKSYTRLPGQQVTVRVTLFLCSFNMGTSAEWLMPTVDRPLTATIISPHFNLPS